VSALALLVLLPLVFGTLRIALTVAIWLAWIASIVAFGFFLWLLVASGLCKGL